MSTIPSDLTGMLARRIEIDTRALAAFRMSLGALLLADLLLRSRDLVAHYTDAGALPRIALYERYPTLGRLSIHALSGSPWFQALLFLGAGVAALALLFGYRTTVATVVSWVLLVSLHARNPVLLNGGDSLLRRLLFWGAFLPLGERWAVDALRRDTRRRSIAGITTAALLVQVVLVYTVNAAFKLRSERWVAGDAIRYVFERDHLTVFLGDVLAGYPGLLRVFDRLWLALIVSSVLLLLLTGRARAAFASLFVVMHLGMLLTLRLGLFPLISIAGLLPFFPSAVWDAFERRLRGVVGEVRERGKRRLERIDTPTRSDGARRGRPLARLPVSIPPLGWTRGLLPPFVTLLLVLVLLWNAVTLGFFGPPAAMGLPVDPAEYRWDMFAYPSRADGWYVVPGRLEAGRRVDAFRGGPVSWDRPPDLASTFPTHRWFVYLLDLRDPGYRRLRPYFADYLCGRWNRNHEVDLVRVTVYYVMEVTRLDGPDPRRRIELVTHQCQSSGQSQRDSY